MAGLLSGSGLLAPPPVYHQPGRTECPYVKGFACTCLPPRGPKEEEYAERIEDGVKIMGPPS